MIGGIGRYSNDDPATAFVTAASKKFYPVTGMRWAGAIFQIVKIEITGRPQQFCHSLRRTNMHACPSQTFR
jgi:hypothetical protein